MTNTQQILCINLSVIWIDIKQSQQKKTKQKCPFLRGKLVKKLRFYVFSCHIYKHSQVTHCVFCEVLDLAVTWIQSETEGCLQV